MKIKELIELLSKENQEADVYIEFNGCTETGERLAITEIEKETFVEIAPADSGDGWETILPLSECEVDEKEILKKQEAICLYSNRMRYNPFYPESQEDDDD
jgi:hypothetical protein